MQNQSSMRHRFRIDLRVLGSKAPPPRGESLQLSAETQEQEDGDPLPLPENGDPRVEAYNASLTWAQSYSQGRYVVGKLQFHVFVDAQGVRHLLTRPEANPDERLSELLVDPGGSLLSRNLVRREGVPVELEELFLQGLDDLDCDEGSLHDYPGYELQSRFYDREGDRLSRVESWSRYYDEAREQTLRYNDEA